MTNLVLIKKVSLGTVGILSALFFGALFKMFIGTPSTGNLIWALSGAAVFLSIFLLQVMLSSDKWLSPILIAAQVLGMSLFFLGNFSLVLAIGILISFGFFLASWFLGTAEIKNNLDIHFPKTSRAIMGFATIGLALFISLAYVGSFDLKDAVESRKNLEVIIRPIEPLVGGYIPNFSTRNTLKDIALSLLPPDFQLVSAAQKAEAVAQVSVRLAETVSNFAGVRVAVTDRVIDIVYKATIGRIVTFTPIMQTLLMVGLGLLFFFLIKFLMLFVDWAAVLLGYALYRLLKAFNFFRIETQEVSKRVIVLI